MVLLMFYVITKVCDFVGVSLSDFHRELNNRLSLEELGAMRKFKANFDVLLSALILETTSSWPIISRARVPLGIIYPWRTLSHRHRSEGRPRIPLGFFLVEHSREPHPRPPPACSTAIPTPDCNNR
jgi:hypothetical protein